MKRLKKPVNIAAAKGHLHVLKYLIDEAHADPMQTNNIKFTGLHNACEKGHMEVIKVRHQPPSLSWNPLCVS
jgi:ankyrin repeat protein